MNRLFLLTFFFLFVLISPAQKKTIFNIPNSIPKPCWVDKVDWSKPNIFTIKAFMKSCEMVSKNRGVEESEMELDEEPYEVAFKRWIDGSNIFIKSNGDIIVDDDSAKKIFKKFIEQQQKYPLKKSATISPIFNTTPSVNGISDWAAMGPLATYENGQRNSWQANIYCLAIAPSDPNILYCGSETGILFKSVNKGLNWFSVSDALARDVPTAVVVDPFNASKVYASMGSSSILIKTIDGGNTWTTLTSPANYTNEIVINPVTGRILIAASTGIYYSDNGGTNWVKSSTTIVPGTEIFDIALNPSDPSIVYAVTAINTSSTDDMVMYRSADGGLSFTTVTLPSSTYCTGARFGVSAANSNYVYCITLQNDVPKLLLSTNNGLTWSTRTTFNGTGLVGTNGNNGMSNGQGYYDLDIMVSPLNINHVIVGTTSAFKSTDGGLNFSPLGGYMGSFPLHPDIQSMTASGNDAYITTDGGVNFSPDFFSSTATFESRNIGLSASDNWGFGQGWSEDIVVGGRYHNGNAALYENYGNGNALRLGGGEDATGHVFQIPGKTGITGFRDLGDALKQLPSSTNGSRSDAPFTNTKWPSDDYYGAFSSKLMQDPRYANIFFVGNGNSLWKSENYGLSYVELKNFGSAVWRFDIARSNPAVMYVCATGGIFKTIDGGVNWTKLTMPSGVTYQYYNTDITINPANENEVWFCMAQGSSANKVFKSTNGGSSWVNYTGTMLSNKSVAFIMCQGGTNSGIYAITNTNPSKIYFRDASMGDWLDYTTGLPNNFNARSGGIIFYRDNKLRITGNRGTWESPLYTAGTPLAMPIANKKFISCSKDTVIFRDHSILEYAGATWNWSFPGASYVSSTNTKEVKVTYPSVGNYSVTLTVTDTRGNSNSRTIDNMISFGADNCPADTIAGQSLRLNFDRKYYSIGTANINSNSFSISCWFRPDGLQNSFAQLISHDPYPGSSYGFGLGFTFSGYSPNLKLCYTDNIVNYGNSTNAIADTSKWNHVVLTYAPTGVTIYLNGVPYVARNAAMSAIDLSQTPFYVNKDIHNQGGDFKGEIDEIKIYNYVLTQNEVREKMHLIHSQGIAEPGLLKYVQFNKIDQQSNSVYELVSGTPVVLPSTSVLKVSGAPVGKGVSFRKSVTVGGQHSFTGTGVDLFFSVNSGTVYPNGEIVVTRLNNLPSFLPDATNSKHLDKYYIINNFGSNKTFTALDAMQLSELSLFDGYTSPSNYSMYKRPSMSYDTESWGNLLTNANYISGGVNGDGQLKFSGSGINSFSQFVVAAPKVCALKSSAIVTSVNSICTGGNSNLSLSEVYDNSLFSFSWFSSNSLNGTYLQIGKDSAGLATGALSGTTFYKCNITCKSNLSNVFTTPVASVQVNTSPLVVTQPSLTNSVYCQGALSNPLSVSVSGAAISKYEWYRNSGSSNTGGIMISAVTTTALSNNFTPPTSTTGVSYYYAIIYSSGNCITKSNPSGSITVNVSPVIQVQPSSTSISYCTGTSATALSVNASIISGTLAYQWYSNSTNSTLGGASIKGATSSSYIPPTNISGSKYYYVMVNPAATCRAVSKVSGLITVNSSPATPASIAVTGGTSKNGVLSGCPISLPTATTYTYTSSTVTNAVQYNWLLPACAAGTSTGTINSIFVKYTGIKTTDSIKVRSRNSVGCFSAYRAVKVSNGTNCTACAMALSNQVNTKISKELEQFTTFQAKVYPNPSRDAFNIEVLSDNTEVIEIVLMDLLGRKLNENQLYHKQKLQIGKDLIPGTYLIRIVQGSESKVFRVVKY